MKMSTPTSLWHYYSNILKWNAGKTYQMENQFVILNSFQCLLCEKDPVDLVLAVGIPT